MISLILLSFFVFLIALLPIYLWGYASSMLLETAWNRRRFLLGMLIGGVSVGMVWLFSYLQFTEHLYILFTSIVFILILGSSMFVLIHRGSNIARIILQKVAIANILIICFLVILAVMTSTYLPGSAILLVTMIPLLLSSLIEESSKHLMSIGLMSQDFRFSRKDILLFTIFVVLGFAFVENILYFFHSEAHIGTWIFRSFFSLMAHLFSAIICAYGWWRALSYPPFSYKYLSVFALGFIIAVLVHFMYNLILEKESIVGLLFYTIGAYILFTRGILGKNETI